MTLDLSSRQLRAADGACHPPGQCTRPPGFAGRAGPRRLALVTDAWRPQVNGVVNTLTRLVDHLEATRTRVLVIGPHEHRTIAMPGYGEIRVALDPWRAVKRLQAFAPDAVHVATEGPLGLTVRAWLSRRRLQFTTSFHTRFPEYAAARLPIPLSWGYAAERWFHAAATYTLVGTRTLISELRGHGVGRHLVHWPRGVDAQMFHPGRRREDLFPFPRPIWLYVGRVAVEKTLEAFLELPLPGTKVVVGDGPARPGLQATFPGTVWRGWRHGDDLATHFASADCFVFPSRTETFGNVILEALASGLPVASVRAPGPLDLIEDDVTGALSDRLAEACMRAYACSRHAARRAALKFEWRESHEIFRSHLVPLRPFTQVPAAVHAPALGTAPA